jgi:pimeloyl-ACP methyl ester carboxylesterase/uncharacterized protein YqfB (UPF0267 family)
MIDRLVKLEIGGSVQKVRLCARLDGLPPILIVQAGPGLPLLNEVTRFQERFRLEEDFLVAYWDQRGCGDASRRDAECVSFERQTDDLCFVAQWLKTETGQKPSLFGVSVGATICLQAAERLSSVITSIVAVSADLDASASDSSAESFLKRRMSREKFARVAKKIVSPINPADFQLRARLLSDFGGFERGKNFGKQSYEMVVSLIRGYGLAGAVRSLRNMNAVQRKLLPELSTLNLFTDWPRPTMPIHYVFGQKDPLCPPSSIESLSSVVKESDTLTLLPDASHMAHFDEVAAVRSVIARMHMKTLKFRRNLVEKILEGSKAVTWRLFDDKDLRVGDRLEMVDSEDGTRFAEADIVALEEKPLGTVSDDDLAENGYRDRDEVLEVNRKLYGERVTAETLVKIVRFRLQKPDDLAG